MFSGHAISFHDCDESDHLSPRPVPEVDEVGDDETDLSSKVMYQASFEELKRNYLQYDTVIWILLSILLVLAWGIGLLMLLYLPFRRYVLRKDISSRKLYITPNEIVYKVTRPSFLPFMGIKKVENRIPLNLVIDIIIEQGCLQSVYGIHTIRIENTAHRKAAPVDELHVQGVFNPSLLRKVIVAEASKAIQEVGFQRPRYAIEGDSVRMGSLVGMSPTRRFLSPTGKVGISTPRTPDTRSSISTDMLLLNKLEEVKLSIKNIEQLVLGQPSLAGIEEIDEC